MLQDMGADAVIEEKDGKTVSIIDILTELGTQKGFEVEAGKDYGAGPIDVVWHIAIHPALRDLICGFIVIKPLAQTLNEAVARGEVKRREDFEDDQSWQEYRYLSKISVMNRLYRDNQLPWVLE
jgi:hypothetical protein